MAFAQFLRDLFQVGQVAVPVLVSAEDDPLEFESPAALQALRDRDAAVRLSLAGEPPPLHIEAALQGAVWLYRGCQSFIDRSRKIEPFAAEVNAGRGRWFPDPSHVYSLDLALSFLPDLHAHARQHAEGDPLMKALDRLAGDWPLSSVGVADPVIDWERVAPWWDHRGLRQLYIDRILARDDADRLQHEEVARHVRATLGAHGATLAGSEVGRALSP